MEKIKLTNEQTFNLVPNGVVVGQDNITLRFTADNETLENIMLMFGDATMTASITVTNEDDLTLCSPYAGYTVLSSVKLGIGDVIGQENVGTEESPEYANTTSDVYTVELRKPGLAEQVEQNKADISYVAMEMGVEV